MFEFGHGLSYTDFTYSRPNMSVASNGEVHIRFRLTNTGDRAGTETAQAYVKLPSAAREPFKRLVGWEHVTLQPGQFRDVDITLTQADLQDLKVLQVLERRYPRLGHAVRELPGVRRRVVRDLRRRTVPPGMTAGR